MIILRPKLRAQKPMGGGILTEDYIHEVDEYKIWPAPSRLQGIHTKLQTIRHTGFEGFKQLQKSSLKTIFRQKIPYLLYHLNYYLPTEQ